LANLRVPNWKKWGAVPEVKLWEGVALSLGIEPGEVNHSPDSWIAGEHLFREAEQFRERLFIASRNLGGPGALRPTAITIGEPSECKVLLKQFVAWAKGLSWQPLPEEFVALGSGEVIEPGLTEQQRITWGRKDLWTIRETSFLLCGRLPDYGAPYDEQLNEATDEIKRGLTAGSLSVVGEPSKAERLYHLQHLRPLDVIQWASGRYPKFPFSIADILPAGQTATSDYLNGRILIRVCQLLDRESARRRQSNENTVADALTTVRATINQLIAGEPIASREISALLAQMSEEPSTENKNPKPSLGTKERDTLLKMVIGLAKVGWKYDPKANKSGVPQEIADDLAEIGIQLDVDTVRKWLKESAGYLPT
jgi:hypothetical protein